MLANNSSHDVVAAAHHDAAPTTMAARSDDMVTTLPDGRPLIDNTGRPIKRKRPQSCDACRTRKTRCIVPVGEGLEASGDVRCLSCRSAAIECSWTYVPKREHIKEPSRKAAEAHHLFASRS